MPATPLTDSKSIKIFLVAPSGWGKTRLAGTSPGHALFIRPPVDYIDSINPEDKPRHKQWVVRDWTAMEDVYEHCRHEGADLYDWVWFDSISSYQDIGLDDLWQLIIDEKPHRKRYGLDKGDYWINMQRLGRWVRDMATLSDSGAFNFGITAWPAELSPSPEDEEIVRKMMPWVQGKNMAMKVCGYTNIVAFGTITSKGTRRLQLNETEHIYAKDQFDSTPKGYLLNPTIPKLIQAIEAKHGPMGNHKPPRRRTRVKKGA
jgi:hypothetical protein